MMKERRRQGLLLGVLVGAIAGAGLLEVLRGLPAAAQVGTPRTQRVNDLEALLVPELKPRRKGEPDEKMITGFSVQFFRVLGDGTVETRSDKPGDRWRPFD